MMRHCTLLSQAGMYCKGSHTHTHTERSVALKIIIDESFQIFDLLLLLLLLLFVSIFCVIRQRAARGKKVKVKGTLI